MSESESPNRSETHVPSSETAEKSINQPASEGKYQRMDPNELRGGRISSVVRGVMDGLRGLRGGRKTQKPRE